MAILNSAPYYIAYLHDKYECPVILLVVCNDAVTAEWARTPIAIGLGELTSMIVFAWVVGPDNLSPITDPVPAKEDVGLAVLAAITNSRSGRIGDILEALAEALDTIDTSTAGVLAELAEAGLADTDGLPIWRALMTTSTYPYVSHLRSQGREEGRQEGLAEGLAEGRAEGRVEGRVEGRAEARAEAVVQVLAARQVEIPDADRERILACRDGDTLTAWLSKAAVIRGISELFTPTTD